MGGDFEYKFYFTMIMLQFGFYLCWLFLELLVYFNANKETADKMNEKYPLLKQFILIRFIVYGYQLTTKLILAFGNWSVKWRALFIWYVQSSLVYNAFFVYSLFATYEPFMNYEKVGGIKFFTYYVTFIIKWTWYLKPFLVCFNIFMQLKFVCEVRGLYQQYAAKMLERQRLIEAKKAEEQRRKNEQERLAREQKEEEER